MQSHWTKSTRRRRQRPSPEGTYVGICLECFSLQRIERLRGGPEPARLVDVVRIAFGFLGPDGRVHCAQTREMVASDAPRAELTSFFLGWLGGIPEGSLDATALVGRAAIITVRPVRRPTAGDRSMIRINGIAPILAELRDAVLRLSFSLATDPSAPRLQVQPQRSLCQLQEGRLA